jgi:hypothetical protein
MDHVVYVDSKTRELEKLLNGSKTMLIRGGSARKAPYGRVFSGDTLYIAKNSDGLVRASADVARVINSKMLTEAESRMLEEQYQGQLQLTMPQYKLWAGKPYLVFIEVAQVNLIPPFGVDRIGFNPFADWLPVGEIACARLDPASF